MPRLVCAAAVYRTRYLGRARRYERALMCRRVVLYSRLAALEAAVTDKDERVLNARAVMEGHEMIVSQAYSTAEGRAYGNIEELAAAIGGMQKTIRESIAYDDPELNRRTEAWKKREQKLNDALTLWREAAAEDDGGLGAPPAAAVEVTFE